jgi:hypothetical protein
MQNLSRRSGDGRRLGVSLKHASAVPAARILVIEDNASDAIGGIIKDLLIDAKAG